MSVPATYFDALHAARPDPFGLRDSWYEQRKRRLLLAMLPRPSYRQAWEIGCSIGELTAALAPRCDRLLATDGAAEAVERARARTCDLPQVRVQQTRHPRDWPPGVFDLIVFSEVGYYFDAAALADLAGRLSTALAPEGSFVACHWRHPFAPAPLAGDRAHDILGAHLPWPRICRYQDADFVLDGWSGRRGSIAEREGKR
jgi:cyclopropane fatty-acyl-phospholipid synthase-like methyltransferase